MNDKALAVIDLQNDITKNYRNIIEKVNTAILWAQSVGMHIIYIKHNNITAGTRTLKPGTKGAELVPELNVVSNNIFVKTKRIKRVIIFLGTLNVLFAKTIYFLPSSIFAHFVVGASYRFRFSIYIITDRERKYSQIKIYYNEERP